MPVRSTATVNVRVAPDVETARRCIDMYGSNATGAPHYITHAVQVMENHENDPSLFIAAFHNETGSLVGSTYLTPKGDIIDNVTLQHLAVAPKYRRQGIAKRLIQFADNEIRKRSNNTRNAKWEVVVLSEDPTATASALAFGHSVGIEYKPASQHISRTNGQAYAIYHFEQSKHT